VVVRRAAWGSALPLDLVRSITKGRDAAGRTALQH